MTGRSSAKQPPAHTAVPLIVMTSIDDAVTGPLRGCCRCLYGAVSLRAQESFDTFAERGAAESVRTDQSSQRFNSSLGSVEQDALDRQLATP